MEVSRRKRQSGQAIVEYILVYAVLLLPLTFMVTFTAQMMWVWNSGVEWTRNGARYAATHCAQAGGGNVQNFMRQNVPATVDQDQFQNGGVGIQVNYFSRDPESGDLVEYECGSECSLECTPDVVSIRVQNYQFRGLQGYLGFAPISMPDWVTTLPIESAGCDPETAECTP
jgi:hypothetical protein